MKLEKFLKVVSSATLIIACIGWMPAGYTQNSAPPEVSVVHLQVINNANGTQSVITPKGDLAPLPGAGVSGNVAQIYIGSQGGFWYVDRTGQTVDLVPAVRALQARRAQLERAAQIPQYAPNPYAQPQQQAPAQAAPTQQSSHSSGAGAAVATAAAAGLGSMAGAAMTNSCYNTPYGTPMYYGPGGQPYYYNNGERRDVEDLNLSPNQKAALYNKRQIDQQQQQQMLQQAQTNRQDRYNQEQQNKQAVYQQAQANRQGPDAQAQSPAHNQFSEQQQWYNKQSKENGANFQQWRQPTENPFVARQDAGARGDGAENSAKADRADERAGNKRSNQRSFGAARGGRRGR